MGCAEQREIAAWHFGEHPAVPVCAILPCSGIDRSSFPPEFFGFQTAFRSDPDSPDTSDL